MEASRILHFTIYLDSRRQDIVYIFICEDLGIHLETRSVEEGVEKVNHAVDQLLGDESWRDIAFTFAM